VFSASPAISAIVSYRIYSPWTDT